MSSLVTWAALGGGAVVVGWGLVWLHRRQQRDAAPTATAQHMRQTLAQWEAEERRQQTDE